MKQSTIFLRGEGDRYHERNAHKPREPDPVFEAIKAEGIKPKSVLEIGCGDGWRLKLLNQEYSCLYAGIDPSIKAIKAAGNENCHIGAAHDLSLFSANSMNMVIYAFCLYLVDREDLFKIVCEGDRVLRDGGYLVIHDFMSDRAYSRRYEHADGVRSYKQDYSKLWLANPAYRPIRRIVYGTDTAQPKTRDDALGVVILRKDLASAWPEREPVNILAAG